MEISPGNVSTAEGTRALIEAGADCVKVGKAAAAFARPGWWPASACPQLTAVWDSARVAREVGVPIMSDGGIRYSGDIVKAIAAGASTVMIGGLFAGTEETPAKSKCTKAAATKCTGAWAPSAPCGRAAATGISRTRPRRQRDRKLVPEGIEGRVPYKGPLADTVFQLIGGLRAGMGYCGAATIDELQNETQFVRLTHAAVTEGHPHDVHITKEAPNYWL